MMYSSNISTTKVFVPHDDLIWVQGELYAEHDDGTVDVKITDDELPRQQGLISIDLSKYQLTSLPLQNVDIPEEGVEDMTSLNFLHEPSILDNLRRNPYTYTSDICIAVNPYFWLDIYNDKYRLAYSECHGTIITPHVYSSSSAAIHGLKTRGVNQSILVTGVSGAGKTETVKILMEHLTYIAGKNSGEIVHKVLQANPLLESFGNAKTIRNDNSSRFGKFTQLEFNSQYSLVGSKCVTYLLEKSRVTQQNPNERNYHIFYEILEAPEDIRKKLYLGEYNHPQDYIYTMNGDVNTYIIEGVTDSDRYKHTSDALSILGVTEDTKRLMEKIIAGILHLGQLSFSALESNADASCLGNNPQGLDDDPETKESLHAVCDLLGLAELAFIMTSVQRSIEVEGNKISVPLNRDQASGGRDSLAKEIYSRLFNWLVLVVNFSTSSAGKSELNGRGDTTKRTISLLDIFGFECFAINRFEQLCINYANEKLQQKFAADVFKSVRKEYLDEGLNGDVITYTDNSETLELIEGRPTSLLSLLDEECMVPRGNDSNYLSKAIKLFSNHPSFNVSRVAKQEFNIYHYAGMVSYTVTGFLEKNKDVIPNNMAEMMLMSTNVLLRRLFVHGTYFVGEQNDNDRLLSGDRKLNATFLLLSADSSSSILPSTVDKDTTNAITTIESISPRSTRNAVRRNSRPNLPPSGSSIHTSINEYNELDGSPSVLEPIELPTAAPLARRNSMNRIRRNSSSDLLQFSNILSPTITSKFTYQLASLMESISTTEVQYVRCVKPNDHKSDKEYNRLLVVEQLRSAGMIDAVRISRSAYPNKLSFFEFYDRYRHFKSLQWQTQYSYQHHTYTSNNNNDDDDFHKKLSEACYLLLMMTLVDPSTGRVPSVIDVDEMFQIGYTKVYFSAPMMDILEHHRTFALGKYCTLIQKNYRRLVVYRWYTTLRICSIRVQSMLRRSLEMIRLRLIFNALPKVKLWAKISLARQRFLRIRRTAIGIQSISRMILARHHYKVFREQMRLEKDKRAAKLKYEAQMAEERERYRREALLREEQQRQQEEVLHQKAMEIERKRKLEEEAAKKKEEEIRRKLMEEYEEIRRKEAVELQERLRKEQDVIKQKELYLQRQYENEKMKLQSVLQAKENEVHEIERTYEFKFKKEKESSHHIIDQLKNEINQKVHAKDELIAKFSYQQKKLLEIQQTKWSEAYETEKNEIITMIEERDAYIEDLQLEVDTLVIQLTEEKKIKIFNFHWIEIVVLVLILLVIIIGYILIDEMTLLYILKIILKQYIYSTNRNSNNIYATSTDSINRYSLQNPHRDFVRVPSYDMSIGGSTHEGYSYADVSHKHDSL